MANIILIKRGQITNIDSAALQEGELALAFAADKKSVQLFAGNGTGTPIEVGGGEVAQVLADAKAYADQKVTDLIGGAPTAYDTLREIADYISEHEDAYQALLTVAGNKLDAPTTAGTAGQVLKIGTDGKTYWDNEADTTYGPASSSAAGLMSETDKAKLDGIAEGANNYTHPSKHSADMIETTTSKQFVSSTEKSTWNSKLDSSSTIDGGTF